MSELMGAAAQEAARLMHALGNAQRLRILCALLPAERASGDIARELGIREPAASQQLALLKAERLVTSRRDGQRILYAIANPVVLRVLSVLYEAYCPRP